MSSVDNERDISISAPEFVNEVEIMPPRHPYSFLSDFTVTTDSVVAKLHIEMGQEARRIFVDWGDFQTDSVKVLPGIASTTLFPEGNSLPDGTYELFHAYEEPEDKRPFDRLILVQIENADGQIEIRQAPISITPRYRVTQYRAYVRLLKPVDLTGGTAKIDISMLVDGAEVQRWKWRPSNNFFSPAIFQVLEGSQLSRELSSDVYETVNIRFNFKDNDTFFDDTGYINTPLVWSTEAGTLETDAGGDLSGKVRLRVDRDVTLIRPLPTTGNLATYMKANL